MADFPYNMRLFQQFPYRAPAPTGSHLAMTKRSANQREECLATGACEKSYIFRAEDIVLAVEWPVLKKNQIELCMTVWSYTCETRDWEEFRIINSHKFYARKRPLMAWGVRKPML